MRLNLTQINEKPWLCGTIKKMRVTHDTSQFHVEVKHHCSAPKRYTWEIRAAHGLSVEESGDQFASWEEASQAGKYALKDLLQRKQTLTQRM
jgi:hypothetical protein